MIPIQLPEIIQFQFQLYFYPHLRQLLQLNGSVKQMLTLGSIRLQCFPPSQPSADADASQQTPPPNPSTSRPMPASHSPFRPLTAIQQFIHNS